MATLKSKENNLTKAQKRFDKYNKVSKQLQVQFTRTKNEKTGKFHTKVQFVRSPTESSSSPQSGLLHRIDHFAKNFIVGDAPSISKSLKNFRPKTAKGKVFKATAKIGNFAVKDLSKTAWHTLLASETAAFKVGEISLRTSKMFIKNKIARAAHNNSFDDSSRAALLASKIFFDAKRGLKEHFTKGRKAKKSFKLEKSKYKLQKAELQVFKAKTYKPQLHDNRSDMKSLKTKFKKQKATFKKSDKNNVSKGLISYRKSQFKQQRKEILLEKHKLKNTKQTMKKAMKNQKRLADLMRPAPMPLSALRYGASNISASAWQKAVYADEKNDVMKVVDKTSRGITQAVKSATSVDKAINRRRKKAKKNNKAADSTKSKFLKKQSKLRKRSSILLQRWKRTTKIRKSAAENTKKAGIATFRLLKSGASKLMGGFVASILGIVLFLNIALSIIFAIFSKSGWVMGTYTAQDYHLSQAEEYYTKLAYNFNNNIRMISTKDEAGVYSDGHYRFKEGLSALGVDTLAMTEPVETLIWGKSSELDYDTADYDFDPFKLWSFLCAYYYEEEAEEDTVSGYWEYDSDTEDILKKLFNDEYKFEFVYDNKSRWVERDEYIYYGGGSAEEGAYYRCDPVAYMYKDKPYKYRLKPNAYEGPIADYLDDEGYICINENYRVLDPDDDYKLTGLFIRDNRYYSDDGRTTKESHPFYYYTDLNDDGIHDNNEFYFLHGGEKYFRSFWGYEGGNDAWFMISPTDTEIWNNSVKDQGLYAYVDKYYWKTDVRLYYNVKQLKTFDQVIEDTLKAMSDGEERYNIYLMYLGEEYIDDGTDESTILNLHGNHQLFGNILGGESLIDYYDAGLVLNGFGYDVAAWNEKHCAITNMHDAIDIRYDKSLDLFAPIDCTIKRYDKDNHIIILKQNDVFCWYDGDDGEGTSRNVEITICNANLVSEYEEGDKLTQGDKFATSTGHEMCDDLDNDIGGDYLHIKVEVDTDGFGWDFIDPLLVFE